MVRLVLFLLVVVAVATALSWLADRPGSLLINWQGYEIETSLFRAVVLLALLIGLAIMTWSLVRQLWQAPASVGMFFNRRRHKRGLEALSSGMIAIGAGDRSSATRHAVQARRALPNEPLTHLLRAQAAQLAGDRATSRRIFEAMLGSPDTELLGLRGLFLEAEREGEGEAARQFAERAIRLNPALGWPVEALFDLQCKAGDWAGAMKTLAIAKRHGHVEKPVANRRRAVLLTAQAQAVEDNDPGRALSLSMEAHNLARDLIPAATIAGRILAARGQTAKAAKVVQRTWKVAQHPDLATAYAYARIGDSPRDRLQRMKHLAQIAPHSIESPIAVATAAIEAREFEAARAALAPLLETRMTQRVATLMARIEGEQHGDQGRVREWLARAVNAPRDAAWTADGTVADRWAPVSPVTGALDAFQWKVPVEPAEKADPTAISAKLEELVGLGARPEGSLAAPAPAPQEPQAPPVRAAAEPVEPEPAAGPAHAVPSRDAVDAEIAEPAHLVRRPPASPPGRAAMPQAGSALAEPERAERGPVAAAASAAAHVAAAAAAQAAALSSSDGRSPNGPVASQANGSSPSRTAPMHRAAADVRIYVPPRAPDDPGTDAADDLSTPEYRSRAIARG